MIDEKKIEAAKEEIYEDRFLLNGEEVVFDNDAKEEMYYKEDIKEAIGLGAKWMREEFLKDLLHDAEEEPKKNRSVLTDTQSIIDKGRICWLAVKLTENGFVRNWSNYAKATKITRWLYLDDLFPKKGGGE